ncbi:MAG: HEPN domain-containing protein [bacterium]|uniref:HEPN domain-containing protein n=1 Tax=Candidatus Methylomirabilis tolerans TaxID=3123416 RepID=A0AAJ1AG32_9BACT|nr:HEPN domain-containing protein [Candidatus Methylomirabilis sp.]
MSGQPEILHLVRQRIERAEEDLTNAEHTLTLHEHCPLTTVCFHAQQCAEKYLKALLTFHTVPFPKTHDLAELLRLVPETGSLTIPLKEIVVINRYAIEARYPGDWEPITRTEAERAVAIARTVRSAVRSALPKETTRG